MIPNYHLFLRAIPLDYINRYIDKPELRLAIGDMEKKSSIPIPFRVLKHKMIVQRLKQANIKNYDDDIWKGRGAQFDIESFPKTGIIGGGERYYV